MSAQRIYEQAKYQGNKRDISSNQNRTDAKANFKEQAINDLKCEICQRNEEISQHLSKCERCNELRKGIKV